MFVLFATLNREGDEHAWAWEGTKVVSGTYFPDCEHCKWLQEEVVDVINEAVEDQNLAIIPNQKKHT